MPRKQKREHPAAKPTLTVAATIPTLSTIADTTQPPPPGPPLAYLLASQWSLADFLAAMSTAAFHSAHPHLSIPPVTPSTSVMTSTPSSVTPQLSGTYILVHVRHYLS